MTEQHGTFKGQVVHQFPLLPGKRCLKTGSFYQEEIIRIVIKQPLAITPGIQLRTMLMDAEIRFDPLSRLCLNLDGGGYRFQTLADHGSIIFYTPLVYKDRRHPCPVFTPMGLIISLVLKIGRKPHHFIVRQRVLYQDKRNHIILRSPDIIVPPVTGTGIGFTEKLQAISYRPEDFLILVITAILTAIAQGQIIEPVKMPLGIESKNHIDIIHIGPTSVRKLSPQRFRCSFIIRFHRRNMIHDQPGGKDLQVCSIRGVTIHLLQRRRRVTGPPEKTGGCALHPVLPRGNCQIEEAVSKRRRAICSEPLVPISDSVPPVLQAFRAERQDKAAFPIRAACKLPLERLGAAINHIEVSVRISALETFVHKHQPVTRSRIIAQVLDAPVGVPCENEAFPGRRLRASENEAVLGEIGREGIQDGWIILQKHLIIIVHPRRIPIYAICHRKEALPAFLPECRAYAHPVYPGAGISVLKSAGDCFVIPDCILDKHSLQDTSGRCVYTFAVDLSPVNDGDEKGSLESLVGIGVLEDSPANGVILVLQRPVNLPVGLVESQAAEVAQEAGKGTQDISFEIRLDQHRGERKVHFAPDIVHCDSLDMSGFPHPSVDLERQPGGVLRVQASR